MSNSPRITFGVIVLNGEPFTRYTLRALYPFAYQIIVVEGAAPGAVGIATAEGHSNDGTLEALRDFKALEDVDGKLIIVTAEDEGHPDGFWAGEKDEQSQAYARRATGDYLWQVDVDEFYQPQDMAVIIEMLKNDPAITAVSFKQITFWGGFDYLADGWFLRNGAEIFHRLFKWEHGYSYVTHRPPTVFNPFGRNLRSVNWVDGYTLARRGILLYHYSLVFPKQVFEKCEYYERAEWARRTGAGRWTQDVFMNLRNPFNVHNVYQYPSWLKRFGGVHPPQIERLRADLGAGLFDLIMRSNLDIERVLESRLYQLGRYVLQRTVLLASFIAWRLWLFDRLKALRREPRRTLNRWIRKALGAYSIN